MFPALTSRYAADLQRSVDAGQRRWLLNPALVGESFARFIQWPARPGSGRVVSRHGSRAVIRIDRYDTRHIPLYVDVARLGRQRGGIWSVTGCHTANMRIIRPVSGTRVSTPLPVHGVANVFEGSFLLVVLNERWEPVGRKRMQVQGQQLAQFSTKVPFHSRGSYAILKMFSGSAKDGKLERVAMVKVALGS
jgi:hypothetical protein